MWRLQKAVYGLRQSRRWWSDKRDRDLRNLKATVAGKDYHLRQNEADSQVWTICDGSQQVLGVICVYVDDFLIVGPDAFIDATTAVVNDTRTTPTHQFFGMPQMGEYAECLSVDTAATVEVTF